MKLCQIVLRILRFDCHPEAKVEATEARCKDRGCWWNPVNVPGVPSCYYPPNYGAYKKDTAPTNTMLGMIPLNFRQILHEYLLDTMHLLLEIHILVSLY